jgi:YHS domain-containing protein
MRMSSRFARILLFLCIGLPPVGQAALAGNYAVNLDKNGVALKGHDPVAYFADGKPTPGSAKYATSVDGATYYFSSADHREQFIADRTRYTPAYGGYCAYGITFRVKVNGDPQAWKIVGDRLYIQSSLKSLSEWSQDIPGNIDKANHIWPAIKEINPDDL